MKGQYILIAEVLIDIEKELRELQLWEREPINPEAFLSEQPFAIDTMTFPQWLQFIFLPRLSFMIEEELELPTNCGVAPMAEQYFAVLNLYSVPLISHLNRIDELLSST